MKYLMTSAAVAALTLSFSAPAYADCAEQIAALRSSQDITGSIASPQPAAQSQDQAAAAPAADAAAVDVAAATGDASQTALPAASADAAIGPTATINKATEEIATSPVEVATQPTAQPAETAPNAEQLANAAGGAEIAPTGSLTSGGDPVDMTEVLAARAEAYSSLGNEGACLNVIEQAKAI
jgi:hypothetical protein